MSIDQIGTPSIKTIRLLNRKRAGHISLTFNVTEPIIGPAG